MTTSRLRQKDTVVQSERVDVNYSTISELRENIENSDIENNEDIYMNVGKD